MDTELQHHGIKGMRWGVRRYQNADGTLTEAGKKRAEKQRARDEYKQVKAKNKIEAKEAYARGKNLYKSTRGLRELEAYEIKRGGLVSKYIDKNGKIHSAKEYMEAVDYLTTREIRREKIRAAITIGATIAPVAIAAVSAISKVGFKNAVNSGRDYVKSVDWTMIDID